MVHYQHMVTISPTDHTFPCWLVSSSCHYSEPKGIFIDSHNAFHNNIPQLVKAGAIELQLKCR